MKRADDANVTDPTAPLSMPAEFGQEEEEEEEEEEEGIEWVTGLFGRHERDMFRAEILQQVVIGMGRLDMDVDEQYDLDDLEHDASSQAILNSRDEHVEETSEKQTENGKVKVNEFVNPYFPLLATPLSVVSSPSSAVSQASTSSTSFSSSHDHSLPVIVEHTSQDHPVENIIIQDSWIPSAPRPSHRTLPPPRDSTPWSSPDLSDSAHLSDLATDPSPFCVEEFGCNAENSLLEGSQNSYLYGGEEDGSDEQAAVGRLSSMSLMAAVAASGLFGIFLSLIPIPHLYRRLSW
jgi:serine/threonine-protein phosphatase 4 regulatory subunit 1